MAGGVTYPIQLGDKTYNVSPLTNDSHDSLENWVREQYVERAAGFVKSLSPDLQDRAMAIAMDRALTITWISGEGAKFLSTVKGVARVLWEGIKQNHPELKYEELIELMREPANVHKANRAFTQLNLKSNGGPKKARAARKQELTRKKKSS